MTASALHAAVPPGTQGLRIVRRGGRRAKKEQDVVPEEERRIVRLQVVEKALLKNVMAVQVPGAVNGRARLTGKDQKEEGPGCAVKGMKKGPTANGHRKDPVTATGITGIAGEAAEAGMLRKIGEREQAARTETRISNLQNGSALKEMAVKVTVPDLQRSLFRTDLVVILKEMKPPVAVKEVAAIHAAAQKSLPAAEEAKDLHEGKNPRVMKEEVQEFRVAGMNVLSARKEAVDAKSVDLNDVNGILFPLIAKIISGKKEQVTGKNLRTGMTAEEEKSAAAHPEKEENLIPVFRKDLHVVRVYATKRVNYHPLQKNTA